MSQIYINTGNIANDGTGAPLRTAFNDTNNNFSQIFSAGPVGSNISIANNTIQVTNTNGNLRLATNGIGVIVPATNIVPDVPNTRYLGSATNRFNTLYAQYLDAPSGSFSGNLYVGGNLNVIGNTITNNVTDLEIANLTITLAGGSSNAILANNAGIVVHSANANILYNHSANSWMSTISITAPSFIGDGSQLTNVNAIINANDLVGNLLAAEVTVSNLTSFGSIVSISAVGDISTTGNVYANIVSSNRVTANYLAGDGSNITNITANSIVGNVPFALNANSAYTANLAALATQAINADTALFAINANLAAFANVATTAQTANASHYSIQSDNANSAVVSGMAYELSPLANLSIAGNITTGGYFIGNGRQLTGIIATADYSNANVAAYLPTYSGSVNDISFVGGGAIQGPADGDGASAYLKLLTPSDVRLGSDAGDVEIWAGNPSKIFVFEASGNLRLPSDTSNINYSNGHNILDSITAESLSGTTLNPNIIYSSLTTLGTLDNLSVTGNITTGNLLTPGVGGDITMTGGNISGANVITANTYIGDGSQLTGLYGNANVATYLPTYTGNLAGNNLSLTGNLVVGNLTANISNIFNGLSNVSIPTANGNVYINANSGTDQQWNFDTTGRLTTAGPVWTKAGDGIDGLVFSPDGSTESAFIRVDGGQNALFNVTQDLYLRTYTKDRLSLKWNQSILSGNTNVAIKSNDLDTPFTWTFENDGTLTFPEQEFLTGPGIRVYSDNVSLGTNGGNVSIWPGSEEWVFGTDGTLTVPGDIYATESNDLNVKIFNSTSGGGATFSVQNRQVDIGNAKTTQFDVAPTNINLTTDFNNNRYQWTFDDAGNIVLPTGAKLGPAYDQGGTFLINPTAGTPSSDWVGMISNDQNVGVFVNDTGVYIDTGNNGSSPQWEFHTDGTTLFPGGITVSDITSPLFTLSDAGEGVYSVIRSNQNPPYGTENYGIEILTTTDNPNVFSSISAGPDYVGLQSTNAGNANVIAQGGYGVTISTSDSAGNNIQIWTFEEGGQTQFPGSISVAGNIAGSYILGDGGLLSNITVSGGSPVSTTGNVSGGNLISTGTISASGNIYAQNFIGNLSNGNSKISIANNGNVTVGLGIFGTSVLSVNLSTGISVLGNILASGYISASGNITSNANVITVAASGGNGIAINGAGLQAGNGIATLLYDNSVFGWATNQGFHPTANASQNLGRSNRYWNNLYSVNINGVNQAMTGYVSATGNVYGGNIIGNGVISTTGNIQGNYILGNGSQLTGITANYSNSNVSLFLASFGSNTISTSGNIQAGYIFGNGSQLTGITTNYSNSNVSAFLASFGSNSISTSGNITANNISGNISITGNVTGGLSNVELVAGVYTWTFNNTGNILLPGNTFAVNYANGTQVTLGGTYGNSNVSTFLAAYGSNTITTTGNIAVGNVSAAGNITGNYILGNGALLTGVATSSAANALTGNTLSSNVTISSLTTVGTLANLTVTGNILTNAQINSTAFTGGNISWSANNQVDFQGAIKVGGTGRILSPGGAASITLDNNGFSAPQVSVTSLTATGNITTANLRTAGSVTATGNVVGNNFIGNIVGAPNVLVTAGSYAFTFDNTGNLTMPANSDLVFGANTTLTSNLGSNGNITINPDGTGLFVVTNITPAVFGNTVSIAGNVSVGSNVSVTGNVYANNLSGSNLIINGNAVGYGTIAPTIGSNTSPVTGVISGTTTGNATTTLTLAIPSAGTWQITAQVAAQLLNGQEAVFGLFDGTGTLVGNTETKCCYVGGGATFQGTGTLVTQITTVGAANYTIRTWGPGAVAGCTVGSGGDGRTLATWTLLTAPVTLNGMTVPGNISITGNVYANNIQSTTPNVTLVAGSYSYTFDNTGNLTMPGNSDLVFGANTTLTSIAGSNGNITVNPDGTGLFVVTAITPAVFGNTVSVTGNITSNNNIRATGTIYGFELSSTESAGDEGGQINLAVPQTNTTLANSVTVDVFQNKIRFFEGSTNAKGLFIDLSDSPAGVGGEITYKNSGLVNAGVFVTLDNIKAQLTTSGQRGLSIATTTGSISAMVGGTYAVSGGSGGSSSNGPVTYNTTASTSLFGWSFAGQGDISTYILTDITNSRTYRITLQIGGGYSNNFISIERL